MNDNSLTIAFTVGRAPDEVFTAITDVLVGGPVRSTGQTPPPDAR